MKMNHLSSISFSFLAGLHPLVVARKSHFVLTGNDLNLTLITRLDHHSSPHYEPVSTNPFSMPLSSSHTTDGKKSSIPHLLVFNVDMQSILFISRSLDKEFMKYITNASPQDHSYYHCNSHSHGPVVRHSTRTQRPHADGSIVSNSFGSQVLKISDTSISVRYRYVASPSEETLSRPLHLLPIEFQVGLLSMASKSSVMTAAQPAGWMSGIDISPNKSEKFNFVVENVKCIASSEMIIQALHEVIELVDSVGEVLLKMRMMNTCEKYQISIVMYTLLGKVGNEVK